MKGIHIFLLVCASIILAGLIITGFGISLGLPQAIVWKDDRFVVESNVMGDFRRAIAVDDFSRLNVDVSVFNIKLEPSDHNAVEYDVNYERLIPDITQKGDRLSVEQKKRGISFRFGVMYANSKDSKADMTIYYNAEEFEDVNIYLGMGAVELGEIKTQNLTLDCSAAGVSGSVNARGKVSISCSMGDINLDSCQGEDLEISVSTGGITIGEMRFDKGKIDVSMGNIHVGTAAADDLAIDISTGDCRIDYLDARKVKYDVSMGSAAINGGKVSNLEYYGSTSSLSFRGELTGRSAVSVSMGDVFISTSLPQSSYQIECEASLGDIKIGESTYKNLSSPGGPEYLRVDVSTGNVEISFGD